MLTLGMDSEISSVGDRYSVERKKYEILGCAYLFMGSDKNSEENIYRTDRRKVSVSMLVGKCMIRYDDYTDKDS
jgi:hypothetical protein